MLLADLDDSLHTEEGKLAKLLQEIKSEETTITHESSLTGDLEVELQETRKRLTELTVRVEALAETRRIAEEALQAVTLQADHERHEVQTHQASLQAATHRLAELNRADRRRQDAAFRADAPCRPPAKRSGRQQGPRR